MVPVTPDVVRVEPLIDPVNDAPPPKVVGAGLAEVPVALERQRRGVSATKLVVTL